MGLDFVKSKEFLNEGYKPSEEEPFMNENHVEYFRNKPGFIQIRAEGEPDIIGKEIIQRIENESK